MIMRTPPGEGLVFGGFRIVDVDVSLYFESVVAAETRLFAAETRMLKLLLLGDVIDVG